MHAAFLSKDVQRALVGNVLYVLPSATGLLG